MASDVDSKKEKESHKDDSKEGAHLSSQPKTISFQFSMPEFDSHFKLKLPFLVILFLIFTFSLFLLAKSEVLSSEWLSQIAFIQTRLLPRLYSVIFILFVVFISASFALAAFFSFGSKSKTQSLFVLASTLVPALIMGLVFPNLLLPFVGLAIGVWVAAFFATGKPEVTLSTAWHVTGNALTAFTLIAFLFSFMVISVDNDFFFDKAFEGLAGVIPTTMQKISAAGASLIENYEITDEVVEQIVTEEAVEAAYDQQRSNLPVLPEYSALSDSQKEQLAESLRSASQTQLVALKADVAKKLQDASENEPEALSSEQLEDLRGQMSKIEEFKVFKNNFPFLVSIVVVSLVSVLKFFVRPVSALLLFALSKL